MGFPGHIWHFACKPHKTEKLSFAGHTVLASQKSIIVIKRGQRTFFFHITFYLLPCHIINYTFHFVRQKRKDVTFSFKKRMRHEFNP